MPELAEVEFFRKQWSPGIDKRITKVRIHAQSRVMRDAQPDSLPGLLTGSLLRESRARGKQMLFRTRGGNLPPGESGWLGVHLGMTGKLIHQPLPYAPGKHDHLVLETSGHALVYQDPRLFGKIHFQTSGTEPDYWQAIPPDILSEGFTPGRMEQFFQRRRRSPVKAVLLDQSHFPGIGNWMADEILWQAGIHPAVPAGLLDEDACKRLYQKTRYVCRKALETVGCDYRDPPASWLFSRRWKDGGICPKTDDPLVREKIGGRTTCYSPSHQVWGAGER